jgi:hypothetical protein
MMATREDVFVRWELSPRMMVIEAPSLEMNQQDLVDTIRKQEDSWRGMSEPHILNASGKDDLGGGIFVGITNLLQNTQMVFESQSVHVSVGTITTASGTPVQKSVRLIDSGATFITDGVLRGYTVLNRTDHSLGDVIDVVSETELVVTTPQAGALNTFEIGDEYEVDSVVRAKVVSGNLVAVDTGGSPIEPLVATSFNLVTVEKATSAALVSADTVLLERIEKIIRNKMITDPVAGTITIFDDDGVTVLLQANIFQDAAGTIPYAGQGAERRERLT